MRILVAITIIFGAGCVLLIGLLSVVHDLLVRTSRHSPSQCDPDAMSCEQSAVHPKVSHDVQ
jgi:hypothetical protein